MKKQSWRPNWKNEAEYPDVEKTSTTQWAWEFLRRNLEYAEDYEKIFNYPCDSSHEFYDLYSDKEEASKELAYKWGIKEMVDPSESIHKNLIFLKGGIVSYTPRVSDYDSDHDCDPNIVHECDPNQKDIFTEEWTLSPRGRLGEVLLKFDLNIPLNQQLESAKKSLIELKDKFEDEFNIKEIKKRVRKNLYPEYLRILDGKEAGAEDEEITRIIFLPNHQSAADANYGIDSLAKRKFKSNLDSANLIMTSKYRYIHLAC